MNDHKPVNRKPLFSAIAIGSMLASGLLIWMSGSQMDQGDTLAGYSPLAVTISFIVALLLSGLVTGQIGLIRGEKPMALPIIALLLNAGIFIAVIVHMPR